MAPVFDIDGEIFEVDVLSFERAFSFPQSDQAVTTMDGVFHWDCLQAKDLFRAVFQARPGLEGEIDRLYETLRLKQPHNCTIPYGNGVVNLDMFVNGCRQKLERAGEQMDWGRLELEFYPLEEVTQWN